MSIGAVEATQTYSAVQGAAGAGRVQRAQQLVQATLGETNERASGPDDIWRELGAANDVRSMTVGEMGDMTLQLYEAGEISLLDHAILSFDPSQGQMGTNESYFLTGQDADGNVDWIAELTARIEKDREMGLTQNAENNERLLGILQKLQAASAGGVDVVV